MTRTMAAGTRHDRANLPGILRRTLNSTAPASFHSCSSGSYAATSEAGNVTANLGRAGLQLHKPGPAPGLTERQRHGFASFPRCDPHLRGPCRHAPNQLMLVLREHRVSIAAGSCRGAGLVMAEPVELHLSMLSGWYSC